MPNYPSNIVDIIKGLQKDVTGLQAQRVADATASNPPPGPNTPTLDIPGLSTSVTYRIDPHTGGKVTADIEVNWNEPTWDTDNTIDALSHYQVSYNPDWSPNYTAALITESTSITYAGMKLASTYNIRVRAVTKKGRLGPYATTVCDTGVDTTPPPQPSNPVVSGQLGGVSIYWDGKTSTGSSMPADFDHIRVHAAFTAGFTEDDTNLIATMSSAGTYFVPANTDYDTTYVRFIAVDSKGNISANTDEVSATPEGVAEGIADGSISYEQIAFKNWGNLQADGSFEEAAQRDNIQNFAINASNFVNGCFSFVNNSTNAFHASWYLSAAPSINTGIVRNVYLTNSLTALPVSSTEKYLLRVAWLAAAGSNGSVTFDLRVVKGDGSAVASTTNITVNGSSGDGTWKTASGWITLPAGAAFATARIQLSAAASTGSWRFDAVELRRVVQTEIIDDAAIGNAQIADAAINNAKIANLDAGKITTGQLSAMRIDLGSGLNLNNHPDPSFEDSRFRAEVPLTGTNFAYEASASSYDGGWRIKCIGNGIQTSAAISPRIRCMAGERFYFAIMAKTTSTTDLMKLRAQYYDKDGVAIGSATAVNIPASVGNNWTKFEAIATAPAQAAFIEQQLFIDDTSTDGTWYFDMAEVRQIVGTTTTLNSSRVEVSPLGIKMYDGGGILTVSVDATSGEALFVGQVQTGADTSEERIIMNPSSTGAPEIRLFPAGETVRYASINSFAGYFGAPAVGVNGATLTGGDGYSMVLADALWQIGKADRATLEPTAVGIVGQTNQLDIYGQLPDHPTHSFQALWGGAATIGSSGVSLGISYGITMATPTPQVVITPSFGSTIIPLFTVVARSSTGFTLRHSDPLLMPSLNQPFDGTAGGQGTASVVYAWLAFRWIAS